MSKLELLLEAVAEKAEELFSGPFSIKEVFAFIAALVKVAEELIDAQGAGADKHQLVREAWEVFERQYGLIDKLDDAIKLPFFLEPFDGPFFRKTVDFLIGQAVEVFNALGWGK